MSECCIEFPGHVSRATISYLVVDCMKYILYYRGQFPLPLDQLKQLLKRSNELSSDSSCDLKVNGHQIYCDNSDRNDHNVFISRSGAAIKRKKQNFIDTVLKFDDFFNELSRILETKNVMEIVLNLGPNMMSPKELYRISLPTKCSSPECTIDYASLQCCKLTFFREIMHSDLWTDLKTDSLLPISVLLLLEDGVSLNDYMEQKKFYSFPRHCRQRTVRFIDKCNHKLDDSLKVENFKNISIPDTSATSRTKSSGVWVKLKPDLKGFKSFSETNRSLYNDLM